MPRVDRTALKVNQFFIITLLVLGFILSSTPAGIWLVLFVMAVMALGTAVPRAGLFKAVYLYVLKPAGLLKPHVVAEDPVQHLFAQGMGAVVLAIGALLIRVPSGWAAATVAGWTLVWLVVALALVNLVFDFCAGCFIYTQLALHRVFVRSEVRGA